jgi:hypothetical protein
MPFWEDRVEVRRQRDRRPCPAPFREAHPPLPSASIDVGRGRSAQHLEEGLLALGFFEWRRGNLGQVNRFAVNPVVRAVEDGDRVLE